MGSEVRAGDELGEARLEVVDGQAVVADRRGVEHTYPLGAEGVAAVGFVRDRRTGALRMTRSDQFVLLDSESRIIAFSRADHWAEDEVRGFAETHELGFEELEVTDDEPKWPAFAANPVSLELSDRAGQVWLAGAVVLALALASPLVGVPAAVGIGIAAAVLLVALVAALVSG